MQMFIRLLLATWLGTFISASALAQPVRTLGRVESMDASGFRIEWPMSGFEARFSGSALTAVIEDSGNNWLNVEVDGAVRALALNKGRKTYKLFSGSKGAHLVRVTRRTGALAGATTFISISAEGLGPTDPPRRRMLVIGDSISAGYGVEGDNQHCAFTPATQNAGLAWPALMARAYGADIQLIAVDGLGVYRNYEGNDSAMPAMMQRALPSEKSKWTAAFPAQLVVVHLGTNDFGHGDPGSGFSKAYSGLLSQMRLEHPDAEIIVALGGMLDPKMLAVARKAVEAVVAGRRAAGDRKLSFVYLDPPAKGRRYGCNWHPGKDAQAYMAQSLQRTVKRVLGWQAPAIN